MFLKQVKYISSVTYHIISICRPREKQLGLLLSAGTGPSTGEAHRLPGLNTLTTGDFYGTGGPTRRLPSRSPGLPFNLGLQDGDVRQSSDGGAAAQQTDQQQQRQQQWSSAHNPLRTRQHWQQQEQPQQQGQGNSTAPAYQSMRYGGALGVGGSDARGSGSARLIAKRCVHVPAAA